MSLNIVVMEWKIIIFLNFRRIIKNELITWKETISLSFNIMFFAYLYQKVAFFLTI